MNLRVVTAPLKRYLSTIYALSSGQGKCGVAVIRVSGEQAGGALKALTGLQSLPQPRHALLSRVQHPQTGETLDKGLVLWFPGPRSFTGEDCCELQIHGGLAVVSGVLNALETLQGLRLARPGEFTRRAFFNGKLDLMQVEGLADLLSAETEQQRKQAFLQTEGCISQICNGWKTRLAKYLAHLEAHIDFDETETIDTGLVRVVCKGVDELKGEIKQHLEDGRRGERLRNGVKTVILGAPNVGKSSLLNALVQRPAAIVTPIEGTTRDVLRVMLDIGGYPIALADTAGLRTTTTDVAESEGIQRALKEYKEADLVILVIDSVKLIAWHRENSDKSIFDYVKFYVKQLKVDALLNGSKATNLFSKECLIILNKIDLIQNSEILKQLTDDIVMVSCKTQIGFPNLIRSLTSQLKSLCGNPTEEHPSMSRARHLQHLRDCLISLEHFSSAIQQNKDTVLVVEYIRKALRHIGKITGTVTPEQLLDIIFKDFCIGK